MEITSIDIFLERFRNQEIFFKPNPGNAGDALIALAAFQLFKKYNIRYNIVNGGEDLAGKLVVYGGGGNLVSYYKHCSNFVEAHHKEAKELIIFPQSVNGHEDLLGELGKNCTIICREKVSFDYVSNFENIGQVLLLPDLVFSLEVTPDLLSHQRVNKLLFLGRTRQIAKALYKGIKPPKFFWRKVKVTGIINAFREDVERTDAPLAYLNIDLSEWVNLDPPMQSESKIYETCKRLLSVLNQFEIVRTNRLHIGISGAKLGKEVHFYNNSYNKNKNVYFQSMESKFPNVIWKDTLSSAKSK